MTKILTVACPTCKKSVEMTPKYPHRPFCCQRCQLIDLGEWAAENNRIAGAHNDEENEYWSEDHTQPNKPA